MLAVYTVTSANKNLPDQWEKIFQKLGPNDVHRLLVVSCPSVIETAQRFVESVKNLFAGARLETFSFEPTNTPNDRNRVFREVAGFASQSELPEAWIWMEHAVPTQRGWLNLIAEEYNIKNRPFMGVSVPHYRKARDKATGELMAKEDGSPIFYQVGSPEDPKRYMRFGVYPADLVQRSTMIGFLAEEPFEITMQNEIISEKKKSFAESERLATIWASKNFSKVGNSLVTGEKTNETEIRKVEPVDHMLVAAIHGCRDATLGFIVLNKTFAQKEARPVGQKSQDAEAIRVAAEKDKEVLQKGIESLKKDLAAQKDEFAELKGANESLIEANKKLTEDLDGVLRALKDRDDRIEILQTKAKPNAKTTRKVPPTIGTKKAAKKKAGRPRKVAVS